MKAGLTSARASLVRMVRWSASPPAGAAMRNARSAGPSLAPKSTGGSSRAKASVGVSTPAVRQCGMAMPPGRPVAEVASRANASSTSWSLSLARPASSTTAASARITSCLSAPQDGAEAHEVGGDEVGHASGSEGSDADQLRAELRGLGDGRAGKTCGGAAVGDSQRQAVRGRKTPDVAEQVAEEAGVARTDGADDGGGRGRGVPGALGGDQHGAVAAEGGQDGAHARGRGAGGRRPRWPGVGLELVGVATGEGGQLLAVGLHQVRGGGGQAVDERLERRLAGVDRDAAADLAQAAYELGVEAAAARLPGGTRPGRSRPRSRPGRGRPAPSARGAGGAPRRRGS